MCFAADHAEIVHFQSRIDLVHNSVDLVAQAVEFGVVIDERIDVYGQGDGGMVGKIFFDAIGKIVRGSNGHLCIHFDVNGRIQFVLTVIVHGEIVESAHVFKGKHTFFDVSDGIGVGSFAEKIGNGIFENTDARHGDKEGDHDAEIAVEFKTCKARNDGGNKDGGRGDDVGDAVGGGRFESFRRNGFAEASVKQEHKELDSDRNTQDKQYEQGNVRFGGAKDLFRRLHDQFRRHDENDDRDQERCHGFGAPMPERMFLVGRLFAHFKADDGHDVAAAVGEVVESVCRDGNGARNRAHNDFARRKQGIEHDPEDPGVPSAPCADGRIVRIIFFMQENF